MVPAVQTLVWAYETSELGGDLPTLAAEMSREFMLSMIALGLMPDEPAADGRSAHYLEPGRCRVRRFSRANRRVRINAAHRWRAARARSTSNQCAKQTLETKRLGVCILKFSLISCLIQHFC